MSACILHETPQRLRIALPDGAAAAACAAAVGALAGVRSTRLNARLGCLVVSHDGRDGLREAVLATLTPGGPAPLVPVEAVPAPTPSRKLQPAPPLRAELLPLALAAAVPWLGGPWRAGAAAAAVAARFALRPQRLRERPLGTLLEGGAQLTLAFSGQAPVVATSLALRWLAEQLSARFVGQSEALLAQLLPSPAEQYQALRDGAEDAWWPLRQLRVGDRLRLYPGDVVPLDGCVLQGEAWLEPALPGSAAHRVAIGDAVAAGERLQRGSLELRVEADAEHSRLARLQRQLRQLLAARPAAQTPDLSGGLALPLTAAALVLGFTGDRARAAALLQADPQQGPDLARPLAHEASLLALARQGLLTAGPETVQRLARSRVLLIEVQGVLSSGRWTLARVQARRGHSAARVRRWIALAVGADAAELDTLHLPERLLRDWCRHGALWRSAGQDIHLADAERLQRIWGLSLAASPAASPSQRLRLRLACVVDGRLAAELEFESDWRDDLAGALPQLAALGFERLALLGRDAPLQLPGTVHLADAEAAAAWLAEATEGGRQPALLLHRTLRDVVPPGSLSLSPLDAEGGAHGLLVGDPLSRLLAARRLAQRVERELRWRDELAIGVNAALMTLGALRLLSPMSTALLHHGMALALLLHSLRLQAAAGPTINDKEHDDEA